MFFGRNQLLGAMLLFQCDAFLLQQRSNTKNACTFSGGANRGQPLRDSMDDEMEQLEKARGHFEYLMQSEYRREGGNGRATKTSVLPRSQDEYIPRPLTQSSRERRLVEMDLLKSLEDSDEAIDELMSLWMIERGADVATHLTEMGNACSPGLVEEELILRHLVDEHDIHFAEPVSRLASLLYFQGRSEESEHWCNVALAVKPWHFEVVHTQVLNALRVGDMAQAIRCQRNALPRLNARTEHKARKEWVRRAVYTANQSLAKATAVTDEHRKERSTFHSSEVWQ